VDGSQNSEIYRRLRSRTALELQVCTHIALYVSIGIQLNRIIVKHIRYFFRYHYIFVAARNLRSTVPSHRRNISMTFLLRPLIYNVCKDEEVKRDRGYHSAEPAEI
jgi:hypothetical protein